MGSFILVVLHSHWFLGTKCFQPVKLAFCIYQFALEGEGASVDGVQMILWPRLGNHFCPHFSDQKYVTKTYLKGKGHGKCSLSVRTERIKMTQDEVKTYRSLPQLCLFYKLRRHTYTDNRWKIKCSRTHRFKKESCRLQKARWEESRCSQAG